MTQSSFATFTRYRTNFRAIENLDRTFSHRSVHYFRSVRTEAIDRLNFKPYEWFFCPCAERHSTKSDSDKYFTWTGDVSRTPAHRCLRAWKASDVIAICKMILGKFQYLDVNRSKTRLFFFSLQAKLSCIHSAKPFSV